MSIFPHKNKQDAPMHLKLIACEIFHRELCIAVAGSPHVIDIQFLSQGLHDIKTENMVARLQREIDATDPGRYDGILLGYALCNNGIVGLKSPDMPMIVPRSHDCIAMFMGSCAAYDHYLEDEPGTYFKTSGWIERDHENLEDVRGEAGDSPFGALRTFEEYVAQYGEENARYLAEQIGGLRNYSRMTYLAMPGLASERHAEDTRREAEACGLRYERREGDMGWITRLCHGPWNNEEFLVLEPGQRIAASRGPNVLIAE